MELRRYIPLALATLIFFFHGATISVVAPIISLFSSEERGLPSYYAGMVVGQDDVGIFLSSLLIFPYFIRKSNYRFYYISGTVGCVMCNMAFSVSYKIESDFSFFGYGLVLRLIEGCSFSSAWIAG